MYDAKKSEACACTITYESPERTRDTLTKFKKTTEQISTKLGTEHPWVKGTQVCSNEGPRPYQRGDD